MNSMQQAEHPGSDITCRNFYRSFFFPSNRRDTIETERKVVRIIAPNYARYKQENALLKHNLVANRCKAGEVSIGTKFVEYCVNKGSILQQE